MGTVIGWDIGGVNIKAARVEDGRLVAARSEPFEIQRAPERLAAVLRELASCMGGDPVDAHAVTMTAELSQAFRTKREGVEFIIHALGGAFPEAAFHVYTVDGTFTGMQDARRHPLRVAAANWHAAGALVARTHSDCILVDVGTTTTDIIPIEGGTVAALGRTDPDRLGTAELLYLGAVRTPVEAITQDVPFRGGWAGVSAEGFALAGDVHVWCGDIAPADYTAPTPDSRPPTREFARERLARVVCADREMLDDAAIDALARHIASTQVERIARALARVRARHPATRTVVAAGIGAFLAARAANRLGIDATHLADGLGPDGARSAPAVAVALLLEEGRAS